MNTFSEFINFKRFVIIISTNLQAEYQHETVALAYDFKDILNGRYSEFWGKRGGYRDNIAVFPTKDIVIKNEQTNEHIILYSSISDYVNSIVAMKKDDEAKNALKEDKYYDPNHMYYRCYNFGTCVEGAVTHINWNCTWNDEQVDGFSVRNVKFMKRFGEAMTFDKFIAKLIQFISAKSDKIIVEAPKIIANEDQEKLEKELKEKASEVTKLTSKVDALEAKNESQHEIIEKLQSQFKDIERIYASKLKDERKTRKVEVDREKTITNRYQRQYNKLNKKYLKDIEEYENIINNLKHTSNDEPCEEPANEKPVEIEHFYLNDTLMFITAISIILNIGLAFYMYLSN